nr:MAG TPA: hypothetical protein [Caudoviricetes sp.]
MTEEEVLDIRDNATAVSLHTEGVLSMIESRGCQDIDSESCWDEWLNYNK